MKIAIIDDLYEDCKKLSLYLKEYFTNHCKNLSVQVTSYQNEYDFLDNFQKDSYDFIFIDYYLNQLNGMQVAKEIRKTDTNAILIFITTSRDFAIESFKVKASGYLVKPIVYKDFVEIMSLTDYRKIREHQFIEITCGYENVKILIKDIIYCDIAGHYTQVHKKDMQVLKSRISFTDFTNMLSPYSEFLSCYRGCIINMKQVKRIEELDFIMSTGEHIPFRKKQKAEIMKSYSDFLFEKARSGDI